MTPEPVGGIIWSKRISPIFLDYISGSWSPIANEILLYRCNEEPLVMAAAPNFSPIQISPYPVRCLFGNTSAIVWSPDGQHVYFGGPLPADHALVGDSDYEDIWVVNREGENLERIFPGGSDHRMLNFDGWLGDQVLVTWSYGGGGHQSIRLLDVVKKSYLGEAFFYGKVYRSNNNYLAAVTGEPSMTAFVITDSPQEKRFELVASKYVKAIPLGGLSLFLDWLPRTNKMLVRGFQYGEQYEPINDRLLLWDVDSDTVEALLPGGMGGLFSPDGRYLVYVTRGPAKLDREHRPDPAGSNETQTAVDVYFQLMDLRTREVSISLPAVWDETVNADFAWEPYHPKTSFSADGRFLGFVTTSSLKSLASYWPELLLRPLYGEGPSDEGPTAVVVDLETEHLVFAGKGDFLPVWSPQGSKCIFRDGKNNLAFLEVSPSITNVRPITEKVGNDDIRISWSYDGNYFTVETRDKDRREIRTFIVSTPDN